MYIFNNFMGLLLRIVIVLLSHLFDIFRTLKFEFYLLLITLLDVLN